MRTSHFHLSGESDTLPLGRRFRRFGCHRCDCLSPFDFSEFYWRERSLLVRTRSVVLLLAGELIERQTLAYDTAYGQIEVAPRQSSCVVEAIGLFIQIPEQVERLDTDIGSADTPLQEATRSSQVR